MRKKIIIGLFGVLAVIQIAFPLSMIAGREAVLHNGAKFRFKTAPVDPYDAFRGRYVALSFEQAREVPAPEGINLQRGQTVFALLSVDEQGFAKISQVVWERPRSGAYLTVKVVYPGFKIWIDMPFDRYYMEESAAPRAEMVYRQRSQREVRDAYVTVRIKDGVGVIEGLYVGGERIEDVVKRQVGVR